jgi:hypothetical protein
MGWTARVARQGATNLFARLADVGDASWRLGVLALKNVLPPIAPRESIFACGGAFDAYIARLPRGALSPALPRDFAWRRNFGSRVRLQADADDGALAEWLKAPPRGFATR